MTCEGCTAKAQFASPKILLFDKMAHLLGSKLCLESLQHDVKDIQEIINDVTSRVGQVLCLTKGFRFIGSKNSINIVLLVEC